MTDILTTPLPSSTTSSTISGLFTVQRGEGPDVLLIAGLSDPAEAWEPQLGSLAGSYRLTAFDNRGAGRSPMIPAGYTVAQMADDAADVLRSHGIGSAHVAGFSGGSITAQELALRHPDLVRSLVLQSTWGRLDEYTRTATNTWRWLPEACPSERAMLEAFFLWIYTPRAHEEGMVAAIIDEALSFPHPQSPEAFLRQLEAWIDGDDPDRVERLQAITVPTLVLAGEIDMITRPASGRSVADAITGATFQVLAGEAHQPFQERPEEWNAIVDAFWRSVDG